ncbi:MAG TPA: hypothetical protein VG144_09740, partial [Gaiellaceae bacterium]|nr:hypothetical protein [Gaiellaceae bacterium]
AEIRHSGVMAVLASVCGLPPDDVFAQAVAARYRAFIITPEETIFPPVHVGAVHVPRAAQQPPDLVSVGAR